MVLLYLLDEGFATVPVVALLAIEQSPRLENPDRLEDQRPVEGGQGGA